MKLTDQLMEDMKTAMKAQDRIRLDVVRFLRSAIKNFEIDHGEASDSDVQKIIASQVKQIKESIEGYKQAQNDNQVTEEENKLEILQSYLPQQLSDEELEKIAKEVIDSLDNPQMGIAIGAVMKKVTGQAEGSRVSAVVKKLLDH